MRNSAGENEETGAGAEAGAWLWAPAPRGVECSRGSLSRRPPSPRYEGVYCVFVCVSVCLSVSLGRWVSGDEAHRLYWHGDIF